MGGQQGEDARLRRDLVALALIGVLLIAALAAGGVTVYRSFYSPAAFVMRYLTLLAHGDAADALALPGVALDADELAAAGLPATASDAMLRQAALGSLDDLRVTGEEPSGADTIVTVSFTAGDQPGTMSFAVARDGITGIAPTWRFAQSPLAVIDVTVAGSMAFDVNGFQVDKRQVSTDGADADPAASVPLLVFAPGVYAVGVDTSISATEGTVVLVDAPRTSTPVAIEAQATAEFTALVQQRVEEFLTDCATQQVLLPTGCPFGFVIENRVQDLPQWSIVQQPQITLVPDGGGLRIVDTAAVAHIDVGVVSLRNGVFSQVSQDVPFTVDGTISIAVDGAASILIGGTSDI
ncbi:MAG: hypothetical protein QM626_04315 [Microbacterium sp.]|uniref:hypothetical protein n=1 Tax=Microbacterium sp. TaxID=51671 RepID=UPI0039E2B0C5